MDNHRILAQGLAAMLLLCCVPVALAQSTTRDPFARSPAVPYREPYAHAPRSCPNTRQVGVVVLEAAAAHHACAVRHMLPLGGRISSPSEREHFDHLERFNSACGAILVAAVQRGDYRLSTTPHEVEIVVVEGWQERQVFSGWVTGDRLQANDESRELIVADGRAVVIPDAYTDGVVVVRFVHPEEIRTPAPSGAGRPIETFKRGCTIAPVVAIEAEAQR